MHRSPNRTSDTHPTLDIHRTPDISRTHANYWTNVSHHQTSQAHLSSHVDPILRVLTNIILPGGEEDLVIVHILLPPRLLTIGLIKDIIREDIIPDLILDILINVLDLHHRLLVPLQEETLREDLI